MTRNHRAAGTQRPGARHGFTLIELMIVVAVIAILAVIAYPTYQDHMRKTRRADAQGALTALSGAMERWYTENNTYQGAAAGGADTGAPTVYATQVPVDGGTAFYNLTIQAAAATTYTVRATPAGPQAGDGYLELDSTGARRWDRNDDGDTGDANETSWDAH